MRTEERQKLESDALVLWVDRAWDWSVANRRRLLTWVAAAAGAALLTGGFLMNRSSQQADARARLAELTRPIQEAMGGEAGQRAPCETGLPDLERLAASQGSSATGRSAAYYAGVCHRAFGDHEAAAARFAAARSRGGLLGDMATMAYAGVLRRVGNPEEAAAAYRSLLDGGAALPADPILFELGVLEEEQGRPEAAAVLYQRLSDEHPDSAFVELAEARRDRLPVEQR